MKTMVKERQQLTGNKQEEDVDQDHTAMVHDFNGMFPHMRVAGHFGDTTDTHGAKSMPHHMSAPSFMSAQYIATPIAFHGDFDGNAQNKIHHSPYMNPIASYGMHVMVNSANNMVVSSQSPSVTGFTIPPRIAPRELPPYVCLPKKSQKRTSKHEKKLGTNIQQKDITGESDRSTNADMNEEGTDVNEEGTDVNEEGTDVNEEDVDEFDCNEAQAEEEPSAAGQDLSKEERSNAKRKEVCSFFIQTGSCAYGSNCKFKHPLDQAPKVVYNSVGLPRRPGQPPCQFFLKKKRCAFGHTCKFDHPEPQGHCNFSLPNGVGAGTTGPFFGTPAYHGQMFWNRAA